MMREALSGGSPDPGEMLSADDGEEGARGRLTDGVAFGSMVDCQICYDKPLHLRIPAQGSQRYNSMAEI